MAFGRKSDTPLKIAGSELPEPPGPREPDDGEGGFHVPLWIRQIAMMVLTVAVVAAVFYGSGQAMRELGKKADANLQQQFASQINEIRDADQTIIDYCQSASSGSDEGMFQLAPLAKLEGNEDKVLCLMQHSIERLCDPASRAQLVTELEAYLQRKSMFANFAPVSAEPGTASESLLTTNKIVNGNGFSRVMLEQLRDLAADGYISKADFSHSLFGWVTPQIADVFEGVTVTRERCS